MVVYKKQSSMTSQRTITSILLLGLVFFAIYFPENRKGLLALKWPTTQAKMISFVPKGPYSRKRLERLLPEGITWFYPEVRYEYQVNGIKYQSEILSFGVPMHYRQRKSYEPGKIVSASYNPNFPSESVLIPGLDFKSPITIGIGALVVGLLVYFGNIIKKIFTAIPVEKEKREIALVHDIALIGAILALTWFCVLFF